MRVLVATGLVLGWFAVQSPVGSAGASDGGPVTLIVGRAAGVSTADLHGALDGVDTTRVATVPGLDATAVTVAADDVAAATTQLDPLADYVQRSVTYHAAALSPADPYYGDQPELGQIAAPGAWNTTTGSGTVVAVIDTGIVAGPDQTDGLGTSIVAGYDEIGQDNDPTDVPPTDPTQAAGWASHGTLVASVLAARANSSGIVGTCPGCKIMPIRALGSDGSGSDLNIAQGIQYATAHGASVINLSLGGADSTLVDNAVDQARAAGIVVVAAAGNDGTNYPLGRATPQTFPAAHPGVLSVASTCSETGRENSAPAVLTNPDAGCDGAAPNGQISSFSGRGASWVAVAAPGAAVATQGTGVYLFTGTSASTPFVAGAAALVRAAHPSWTEAQVRAELVQSAAPVTPAGSVWGGEIRAAAAVSATNPAPLSFASPPVPAGDTTPPTATIDPPSGYLHDLGTAVVHASDNVGVASVVLYADGQPVIALRPDTPGVWWSWWNTANHPDGNVSLTALVTDTAGNSTMTAPVGGQIDNTPPSLHLFGPPNGSNQTRAFGVVAVGSDNLSGIQLMLVGAGGRIVGGSGGGPIWTKVPVTRRGRLVVVAAAADAAGHIAFSNPVIVNARPGRR